MHWNSEGNAVSASAGTCPICGRSGDYDLKVRFFGGPSRSLDRRIELIYASCCHECPEGLNHRIAWYEGTRLVTRPSASSFLGNTGTSLGNEMARRLVSRDPDAAKQEKKKKNTTPKGCGCLILIIIALAIAYFAIR